jgi:hypothetical protein
MRGGWWSLASPRIALDAARPDMPDMPDMDFLRLDGECFAAAPDISIDYAVMEKTGLGVVVPLSAGWSDVGSWTSLSAFGDTDADGNLCIGNSIAIDSRNNYIRSEKPLVAVLGLENPGPHPLRLIEVQSGDYIGEDDIVRLEDAYGRAIVRKRPLS